MVSKEGPEAPLRRMRKSISAARSSSLTPGPNQRKGFCHDLGTKLGRLRMASSSAGPFTSRNVSITPIAGFQEIFAPAASWRLSDS